MKAPEFVDNTNVTTVVSEYDQIIFDYTTETTDDLVIEFVCNPDEMLIVTNCSDADVEMSENSSNDRTFEITNNSDIIFERQSIKETFKDIEIEQVLDHRHDLDTDVESYFVKWKNQTSRHNMWIPAKCLETRKHIDKFNSKRTGPAKVDIEANGNFPKEVVLVAQKILSATKIMRDKNVENSQEVYQVVMDNVPADMQLSVVRQNFHRLARDSAQVAEFVKTNNVQLDPENQRYYSTDLVRSIRQKLVHEESSLRQQENPDSQTIEKEEQTITDYVNSQQLKVMHDIEGLINVEY